MRLPSSLLIWGPLLGLCLTAAPAADAGGFPATVEKVQGGTVMIEARGSGEVHYGTGFILEDPGVLITALHVVEGARDIKVAIPETFETSTALLVGGSSEWDVAVLQVPSWPEGVRCSGLRLSPGRGTLPVGTEVAYTGYGYGHGSSFAKVLSTYRGIISSRVPHGGGHLYHLSGLVSRGLSGSALYLPVTGEVVGVVTRHFGPPELGLGFGGAAPAAVVKRLTEGITAGSPCAASLSP